MQEQESLRAVKVWPHKNVKNEWRGAVGFQACDRSSYTGCAQNKGIWLQLQGQMGLKLPDKLPFPNMLMVQPLGGWAGWGKLEYLACCLWSR